MSAPDIDMDALIEEGAEKTRQLAGDVISEAATRPDVSVGDYALATIAATLRQAMGKYHAEAIEEEADGRDGQWDTEWYVFSAEKGHVLYKSEDAAREGGRYWVAQSEKPEDVSVYARSIKRYEKEVVPREYWVGSA